MTHPISNAAARVAIVLAVTAIVLTAVVGAGGVAAEPAPTPASTAGEAETTTERAQAVAAHQRVATESPDRESGIASGAAEGADITLSVVEETDDSITVSLATSAADAMAYAAGLSYDEDVVTVEEIDGAEFDAPVTNVSEGTVRLTQSRLPEAAVDEPELATISFTAAGAGETSLSFDEAETIVETPDGEVTPLETRGLTLSVGDEDGGAPPIGGAPGGADDETGVARNESDEAGADGDGSTDETGADGETTGTDTTDRASDEQASQADEDGSPVPGFTATAAVLAVLAGVVGRARSAR